MRRLNKSKKEVKPQSATNENAVAEMPGSVLEAFEHIVKLAKNSCLDAEFFDKASTHISFASSRLKLPPMQTVMLALFVNNSEDNKIFMSEIGKFIGCSSIKILRLSKEIDALEQAHYLIATRSSRQLSYRVPFAVLEALKNDEPYVFVPEPVTDVSSFFDMFSKLAQQKDEDELTYAALLNRTKEAFEAIKTSHFAQALSGMHLCDNDLVLFVFMANLFAENCDDRITFCDIDDLYDNEKIPRGVKMLLTSVH